MKISIHIPTLLLEAADQKARTLKISRNRLIIRALEKELMGEADWSPGFFEKLRSVTPETKEAIDELLTVIRQR
jgi:metal-responsive CopG/Arc/MetJ family transcriptional regulator